MIVDVDEFFCGASWAVGPAQGKSSGAELRRQVAECVNDILSRGDSCGKLEQAVEKRGDEGNVPSIEGMGRSF